ncbi:KDO2-lipid IV(A) lauroyltransferase [Limibacillus sp. MBR-115]
MTPTKVNPTGSKLSKSPVSGRRGALRLLQHALEVTAFRLSMGLMRLLPLDAASALGGFLGRTLGPYSSASERAARNLRLVFPDMPDSERRRITRAVWDNLGRLGAEYPHLAEITDPRSGRLELRNSGPVTNHVKSGRPAIVVSGHFANFEAMHVRGARELVRTATVVRDPNNPMIRDALEHFRKVGGGERVGKGHQGARSLIAYLERNFCLTMLVDQRMNRGITADFLGHPAQTPTAAAQLALRFDCPLVVATMERKRGAHFIMTLSDLIWSEQTADRHQEIARLVGEINQRLGTEIRRRPENWFWLHRRWSEEVYAQAGL